MNPLAILGIVAAAGAGLAIATRKRNAAADAIATYWRRRAAGESPEVALGSMIDTELPRPLLRQAAYIVARGRPGRDMVMNDPYTNPETGVTTNDPHWGKDIRADRGTEVYAAKTGIVTYCENRNPGFGRMIYLSHLEEPQSTLYAHLDGFNVGLGQLVMGGDVLGFVGNSCSPIGAPVPAWCAIMGTHLHFEVHASRIPVMGAARDNVTLGRRECLEPVTWLEDEGIDIVGELT